MQRGLIAGAATDVFEQEPISPQLINPLADPDLVTICLKCLEKDPRRRYASAEAMAVPSRTHSATGSRSSRAWSCSKVRGE